MNYQNEVNPHGYGYSYFNEKCLKNGQSMNIISQNKKPDQNTMIYENSYYDPVADKKKIKREKERMKKRELESILYKGGYALNGKNVYSPAYPY